MVEESSLEEGEIRHRSSSLEQTDAPPLHELGPCTTSYFIQEEMISNLVQFLKAGPCRHIMWGIIKGILEELRKTELDHLEAFFRSSVYIGTTTIQTFGGNTLHWTTFCAVLANNIHELTNLCQPITCDPCVHEKIVEWEAELEKLKKLEQKESFIQLCFMQQRMNRDCLILELYKKTAITIDANGGVVQKIQQHEAALERMEKELKEVAAKRQEVSEQCDQLRQLVVRLDSDRLKREINAHDIYRHVCATLKILMEKLEEPTGSL